MYLLIQDPDEGNHPGYQATVWCNEDANNEEEKSDDTWYVTEVDLFNHADCNKEMVIESFQRYHGDDVTINWEEQRVEFPHFEYVWLPYGLQDPEDEGYDTLEEYVKGEGVELVTVQELSTTP